MTDHLEPPVASTNAIAEPRVIPGLHTAVVAVKVAALIAAPTSHPLSAAIATSIGENKGIKELAGLLSEHVSHGTVGFALVEVQHDTTRILVRHPSTALVRSPDGVELRLSAEELVTWLEAVVPVDSTITLLPVATGLPAGEWKPLALPVSTAGALEVRRARAEDASVVGGGTSTAIPTLPPPPGLPALPDRKSVSKDEPSAQGWLTIESEGTAQPEPDPNHGGVAYVEAGTIDRQNASQPSPPTPETDEVPLPEPRPSPPPIPPEKPTQPPGLITGVPGMTTPSTSRDRPDDPNTPSDQPTTPETKPTETASSVPRSTSDPDEHNDPDTRTTAMGTQDPRVFGYSQRIDAAVRSRSETPDDHTISLSVLRSNLQAAATKARVQAVLCPDGHPNPTHADLCRTCGTSIVDRSPHLVSQPRLGSLRFADGTQIHLDRHVVLGRRPTVDVLVAGEPHELVTIAEPEVSRTHLVLRVEGWQLHAIDRDSTNNTFVEIPGQPTFQLRPGDPYPVPPGTTIRLGDEVTLTFDPSIR